MSLIAASLAAFLLGSKPIKKQDCPLPRQQAIALLLQEGNGDVTVIIARIKARLTTEDVACWAATGDRAVMLELAKRLETGDGVPLDAERAEDLYEQAAAFVSGTTYIYSPPVGKSPGMVMPVRIGPDIPGLPEAQFRRALMHIEGRAVKSSPGKGFKLMKALAKRGYQPAIDKLAALPRT